MSIDDKIKILFLVMSATNVVMEYSRQKTRIISFSLSILLFASAIYFFMR